MAGTVRWMADRQDGEASAEQRMGGVGYLDLLGRRIEAGSGRGHHVAESFDNLDHGHLRKFLQLRVRDGVLLRLIDKWLKAGVMEDGCVSYPEAGSPQGGVISPLLSNVFLHYVLDLWFEQEVRPRLQRPACLVRYADDFVIGFCDHRDAKRVMEVLPKRFGKYGLTIHPTKTKLVPFRPPSLATEGQGDSSRSPGRSTYWGSPTTGDDHCAVTGSSSKRRQATASAERCGASTAGVGTIGTGRSGSNSRS